MNICAFKIVRNADGPFIILGRFGSHSREMDDVFDMHVDDKQAELELANQEWAKKMHEVTLTGEREALTEGFESRLGAVFDKGLNDGFVIVKDFGTLKGRLLFQKSKLLRTESAEHLLSSLQSVEADVVRELALNNKYSAASEEQNFSPDLVARVNHIKNEINQFLQAHKLL